MSIDSTIKLIDSTIKYILQKILQSSHFKITEFLDRLQTIKAINRYVLSDFYKVKDVVTLFKGYVYVSTYAITLSIFFPLYHIQLDFNIQISK